jgi:hypothetical protein
MIQAANPRQPAREKIKEPDPVSACVGASHVELLLSFSFLAKSHDTFVKILNGHRLFSYLIQRRLLTREMNVCEQFIQQQEKSLPAPIFLRVEKG